MYDFTYHPNWGANVLKLGDLGWLSRGGLACVTWSPVSQRHPDWKFPKNLNNRTTESRWHWKFQQNFRLDIWNDKKLLRGGAHTTSCLNVIFLIYKYSVSFRSLLVGKTIKKSCNLGKGAEKKPVFFMVFCQTGGRGVSEGSEKTILLFWKSIFSESM